jgi:hypothetical protein
MDANTFAQLNGMEQQFDYTNYSHQKQINVIPKDDMNRLIMDAFRTLTDILRGSYGPYGNPFIISEGMETVTTKDGFNIFNALGFSNQYKRLVYLALKKISDRVNDTVGDGTTSCNLLADYMFETLSELIATTEGQRRIFRILEKLEADLRDQNRIEALSDEFKVQPLTIDTLSNVIRMASNYDDELTDVLTEAMAPKVEDGKVVSVRNIIPQTLLNHEASDKPQYELDFVPGDYRLQVNAATVDMANSAYWQPCEVKIVLYDHGFNPQDWELLMKPFEEYTGPHNILVLARNLQKDVLINLNTNYIQKCSMMKKSVRVQFFELNGKTHQQAQLKDLAAVLKLDKIRTVTDGKVDIEAIPTCTVHFYRNEALCFYNCEVPEKYVEKLEDERRRVQHSYAERKIYSDRINALKMRADDTLMTITAPNSLELKCLSDKIDDCVSIVNSAISGGVIPNMLSYGHYRVGRAFKNVHPDDKLTPQVMDAIQKSITRLFEDIWVSKYGDERQHDMEKNRSNIYDGDAKDRMSYDIINEKFVSTTELPTSVHYDLEVICAALSIVKYLLTSRGFIFDANLLKIQGDTGRFVSAGY